MAGRRHRAQLILFLAAVFVPCAVLVALSVWVVNQDRQLLDKRKADERKQIALQARRDLLAALDPIPLDEIRTDLEPGQRYRHPETVFVGWMADGQLALPWEPERDRAAARCRDLLSQPRFAAASHACDRLKSQPAGLAALNRCYGGATAAAENPVQAAYARWLWAKALSDAGQTAQAAVLFRTLLDLGPEIADEDGVPLKLHAAQSLLQGGVERGRIAAGVESVLSSRPWLAPMASFVLTDVLTRFARGAENAGEKQAADNLLARAAAQARLIEQAESLQQDFHQIQALLGNRPPNSWAVYGDDLWLIRAAGTESGAAVFAVRGQDMFRRLGAEEHGMKFTDARYSEGEPLGESFPGLNLVIPAAAVLPDAAGEPQRRVLYLAPLLVVSATVFAAYLLWRDLKREMRLSELRTQFVSSVSHELKTPLTAIRMFAETLQMGRCADPEIQAEYLGTIVNECERLSRLVDGVLLFSKSEQGKRTYRFRPMQAADALRAAARAMEYPLSQHGFRLRMDVQDDLPAISADRDAIEQAILNLLSNAMKYSGDARDIELGLSSQNGEVVVRVADSGIGIAPEEQSRIFEKFYRAPTPENQLIPGAGLGLALVAQIVKAHGGRVEVESAPGKGSVFSLRFPAQAQEPTT